MSTAVNKSPITTHILDTATGLPAANVPVTLFQLTDDSWQKIAQGTTNQDGRIADWLSDKTIDFGTYKLKFDLDTYFNQMSDQNSDTSPFYPFAEICFRLQDQRHHHIPLLLSPFGYSTYRGS